MDQVAAKGDALRKKRNKHKQTGEEASKVKAGLENDSNEPPDKRSKR